MKRTISIVLGILLVLGIGFAMIKNKSSAKNNAIQTAIVRKSDFKKVISSSGKTAADRSVDLKFQTAGKLAWVNVKEGDHVEAYQAIAGMDVREVQKTLEKTLKDYSIQRNTFEETRKYDTQANKPADALNERMKYILEENQWDLDKAVLDVELDHLAVELATLVTPISGIVTHIDTPIAGVNFTAATAVFTIVDPDSLLFQANVDEVDVGSLSVGQRATIALDAFPEASFSGKISYVSFTSQLSAGGATVFPVKIAFDDPQKIRIGLNGDVSVEIEHLEDAIMIPIEALREDDSGKYVYKKVNASYERVPVEIDKQNETDVVVTSGLMEGDTVVTKGFSQIGTSK